MSHEIRTLINAVLGMDTMILRESKDMQIKEYALDIKNAGQNLLSLINDILDFSKIESGKLEIINVEYDLSSMIHDISNMIKAKAEAKKLKLEICVDESLPSKLYGDDVRVRQVLVNLLNNAVKYTKDGKVTLTVQGRIEGRKGIFDFSVEDTGIGIKEEDIEKLFKEFERIEEKRNRNIEGTGLGINITTQLLQLMGSKLDVESVYGEGSKFFFTLEQQIIDSTPVGNLEQRIKEQSGDYSYMATFTAPEAKILVVDDNLTNLKVFVNLLKYTKVNVDVVDSGKGCLELVAANHYDLIFLDHMMPEMDGIETLHRMKEMDDNKCERTPVIALTANAITGAKEMYLREGFDAFLPKHINPDKLEQMILRLLPRHLLKFDAEGTDDVEVLVEQRAAAKAVPDADELPMIDGIDWSYGLMHLPDKELLMETVSDFYKALNVEADSLEGFYRECKDSTEALNQYRIKVHAMKSSANLIGAIVLGGMAKVLENAARDGNIEVIDALHDIFIKEWR
ncbi:MAG: response regulator, partial [Lachnospiraceae bacterium]|nr:response regulator [Lachnospiraceae bacterium]